MNSIKNSVSLIGNLGQDVELKESTNGNKWVKLRLATNEYYKNDNGERVKQTQWHNITCWGKTAELMNQLLKKGSEIAVKGKLVNRSYKNKEGNTVYTTEVRVNEFMILGKKEEALPF